MKIIREKELSLNTSLEIADQICKEFNKIPTFNLDIWQSVVDYDDFVANWATIKHLKNLKYE